VAGYCLLWESRLRVWRRAQSVWQSLVGVQFCGCPACGFSLCVSMCHNIEKSWLHVRTYVVEYGPLRMYWSFNVYCIAVSHVRKSVDTPRGGSLNLVHVTILSVVHVMVQHKLNALALRVECGSF
jgi:hypothetical protein